MSVTFSPGVKRYLDQTIIPMRFACNTPTGRPVVLSLWYIRLGNTLYGATQSTARVVSYIEGEPRCAYEIASDLPPYCGIRGQGIAMVEPVRGAEILGLLINRYLVNRDTPLSQQLLGRAEREVAIRIEPTTLYQWDFGDRMKGSFLMTESKVCP